MTNTENDADKGIVHFGGESKEVIEAEDRWHKAIEENETELGRAFASGMKAGRQKMYIKGFKDGFKHSGEGFNGEYAHPDLPKNFLARDAKEALSSLDKPLKD